MAYILNDAFSAPVVCCDNSLFKSWFGNEFMDMGKYFSLFSYIFIVFLLS